MAYSLPEQLEADLAPWEIDSRPSPSRAEVEELRAVINSATDERPIQSHLARHPRLFSPLLGGGHGRWVRPEVRLSNRYVADFLMADADSLGINWTYVELESPRAGMFLQSGELAEKARHGIHQIHQWRDHIDRNGGEARRLQSEGGLGLPDIRSKGAGLVLVGRQESMGLDLVQRRRQLLEDERIMLHTYDWLVDQLIAIADDPHLDHHLGGVIPWSDDDQREIFEQRRAREEAEIEKVALERGLEADEDLAAGRSTRFESDEEFLAALDERTNLDADT